MTGVGGILQYDDSTSTYRAVVTGVEAKSAVAMLSHLTSRGYRKAALRDDDGDVDGGGGELPPEVTEFLESQRVVEEDLRRQNRKRKLVETKERLKKRKVDAYMQGPHAEPGALYRAIEEPYALTLPGELMDTSSTGDAPEGLKFDCGVCQTYVSARAFLAHVQSAPHLAALSALGVPEDQAFIEEIRERCVDADRKASGATLCAPCGKWITPNCAAAHQQSRAHLRNVGGAKACSATSLINQLPRGDAIRLFTVGEAMYRSMEEMPYTDVCVATLHGHKVQLAVRDTAAYGTPQHPAMLPAICPATAEEVCAGVLYTIDRECLERLVAARAEDGLALAAVDVYTADAHETFHALAFLTTKPPPLDFNQTANAVCQAAGPHGSNFALLVRVAHEADKLPVRDRYLTKMVAACERILWPTQRAPPPPPQPQLVLPPPPGAQGRGGGVAAW